MPDRVLIAGAGPTGLTAALELSRHGIPVRIIDEQLVPATTSRAIGVQARTLELLEQRGLAEEMVRLGNPGLAGSVYGGGKRVFRVDFSNIDSRYHYLLFISQAETERILRSAIEKQGVVIERGVKLVAVAQETAHEDHPNPVTAVLSHQDGRLELERAPWLISAEGSHSTVRATLNLPFEGKTLDQQYALGDLHIDGELPETDFHLFSSEHGFMALFPMGGRRFRLMASHPMSKATRESPPSLDELQSMYNQRSHIPARLRDMSWSSWFRINSRMVPRMRVGRLLLGGDAVHIHSPAGARGMNTGIQDMINLAWKLALVVKRQAPPSLLDTYEQERLPVIRNVLTRTEELTDAIGSENPIVRSVLNHLGPWIGGTSFFQENSTARISQVGIAYRESPLSVSHAHGGLHAGDRVPDLTVRRRGSEGFSERPLYELLDPSRFTLVVATAAESVAMPADLREVIQPFRHLIGVVEVAPAPDAAARARFQARFGRAGSVVLVRPDGYVGLIAGAHGSARHLDAYGRQWLSPPERGSGVAK